MGEFCLLVDLQLCTVCDQRDYPFYFLMQLNENDQRVDQYNCLNGIQDWSYIILCFPDKHIVLHSVVPNNQIALHICVPNNHILKTLISKILLPQQLLLNLTF